MPVLAAAVEETGFFEPRAKFRQIDVAEFILWRDGQLEGRALQMVHQNFKIVRLDVAMLR